MKYIDADKLLAEIDEKWKELADKNVKVGGGKYDIEISTYLSIKNLITSLQQKQPEPSNNLVDVDAVREDFITEVYRILDADPTNDRANAIIDAFDSLPTVSREQPEVDLEKEIHRYFNPHGMALQFDRSKGNTILEPEQLIKFARHFAEWGAECAKK